MKLAISGIATIVSILAITGCTANVQVPSNTANNATNKPCVVSETNPCPDGFDKTGAALATGGRWVYDASTKAWNFLSSDEAKAFYDMEYNRIKKAAVDAYQDVSK